MPIQNEIQAIPTEYRGVRLRSRLEAQCAFLLDKLGWEWKYEPQSFMLPNGVSYTPDFFIPDHGLFVECRGYDSERGWSQIYGFAELVMGGKVSIGEDSVERFVVIFGDKVAVSIGPGPRVGYMFALVHCAKCGWTVAGPGEEPHEGVFGFELFCASCISPLYCVTNEQRASVDRAAIVTVKSGRILVNGVGVEDFA